MTLKLNIILQAPFGMPFELDNMVFAKVHVVYFV
jgi:hypothetical protein